eukprot:TRINITY_DN898_c0_g1_i7.p3 TRINITY_DN898_c0_g1~~TRINITY_DN898_c0_g1_i7.p3  ORF type:complete len:130 (+),score=41.18 TRINITY_DN898_c0_g1_i7:609-998(+)
MVSDVDGTSISSYVTGPGDQVNGAPINGLQTLTLVSTKGRQGAAAFSALGLVGTKVVPVNVTGGYADAIGVPSVFMDIFETPLTKSDSVTFFLNLYLPVLTGDASDIVNGAVSVNVFFGLIFMLILSFF